MVFVMSPFTIFMFFVISHYLLLLSAEEITDNPRVPPLKCGKLNRMGFPFANTTNPECGLCTLDGCTEDVQKIQLEKDGRWYQVENISQANNMIRIRDKILKNFQFQNCILFYNITPLSSPFISVHFDSKNLLTLFKCKEPVNDTFNNTFNHTKCNDFYINYNLHENSLSFPTECEVIQLPLEDDNPNKVAYTFSLEAVVTVDCLRCHFKRGQCMTNSEGEFHCANAENEKKDKLALKLGADFIAVATAAGIGMVMVILAICFPRKFLFVKSLAFWRKKTDTQEKFETFLKTHECLIPKRYSYKQIKTMTNSFEEKLGEGGYGIVYKGKLGDGSLVAVKVLNNLKGDGEEFINEVASISRTSHVNIVSFLGFCFEGTKRAVIYEFMPNGSLEKFRYGKTPREETVQLGTDQLYMILLGIAQGLEYLHRGCNAKILHFDIKPHNILLDENFCPKISDFGLSKVCGRQDSIISMLGARGTPGYIAPEVFSRNFGGISHKSDVYSYGMMVLEMVGGQKNIDVNADHSSEIYFPHWIFKRLELDGEFGLQIMNQNDKEIIRKMIIVGLWCIQTDPSKRPPMSRVVDMLEGSLHSLQIPHRPFVYSPVRTPTQAESSTEHTMTL